MLEGIDFSKLSPYDNQRVRLVSRLCACREALADMTAAQTAGERTKRIAAQQRIRLELPRLATDVSARDLRALAKKEGKQDDLDRLHKNVVTLQEVYRRATVLPTGDSPAINDNDDDDPRAGLLRAPAGGAGGAGAGGYGSQLGTGSSGVGASVGRSVTLGMAGSSLGGGGVRGNVGLSEDEEREFGAFVQDVLQDAQRNDALMDEKLDVIHRGVQRLRVMATGLTEELAVGEALMTSIEERVDSNTSNLRGLNAKLDQAIVATREGNCCLYIVCCMILLIVVGMVYYTVRPFVPFL